MESYYVITFLNLKLASAANESIFCGIATGLWYLTRDPLNLRRGRGEASVEGAPLLQPSRGS